MHPSSISRYQAHTSLQWNNWKMIFAVKAVAAVTGGTVVVVVRGW